MLLVVGCAVQAAHGCCYSYRNASAAVCGYNRLGLEACVAVCPRVPFCHIVVCNLGLVTWSFDWSLYILGCTLAWQHPIAWECWPAGLQASHVAQLCATIRHTHKALPGSLVPAADSRCRRVGGKAGCEMSCMSATHMVHLQKQSVHACMSAGWYVVRSERVVVNGNVLIGMF